MIITTVELKDGVGDALIVGMVNIGPSNEAIYLPTHVPVDQYGDPLFTLTYPGTVGFADVIAAANFNRPNNTTQYNTGQLVANDTTAGNVVPMALAVASSNGRSVRTNRARLTKSNAATANAIFRAHLYKSSPTAQNGDGGTWLTNQALAYVGSFTFDMTSANARVFSDGAKIIAMPDVGSEQIIETATGTKNIYALLEARAPYTPVANETFTLALEVKQD